MNLKEGESATCGNCGKAILGPGAWGINPLAVCHCCSCEQRAIQSRPLGCVCPPGAEATCQGIACPRKWPAGFLRPQQLGGTGGTYQ